MNKYIVILMLVFAGCGIHSSPQTPKENKDFSYTDDPGFYSQPQSEGSLWQGDNAGFFADGQAHKKGDTIIVDIVENSSSQTAASTTLERESEVSAGIPSSMGLLASLAARNPRLNPASLIGAETTNDFEGSGSSDRSTTLQGSLGARVVNVLPNGDLVISGQKNVKINNETQIMKVKGIVRPGDIGSDNRVESTYLSNADIEISGQGVISDKQKPGWMARIFDHVWPF